MALGWLGTSAQGLTQWLALASVPGGHATRLGGSSAATPAVGFREGLAGRLEQIGARTAALNLREAERLFQCMQRQSRAVMGLPPTGPDAVSHYLKESGSWGHNPALASAGWGERERCLCDAMEQQAILIHAASPASGAMKLQSAVISDL
jgi:hypothetical protein